MSAPTDHLRLPDKIRVYGAGGGVGTTTVALSLAVRIGATGRTVSLTAVDPEALRAYCGRPTLDYLRDLAPGVNETDEWEPDVEVYDGGTSRSYLSDGSRIANVLVLRNSYLAVRRMILDTDTRYDLVVVFVDPDRPILVEEVERLTDAPVLGVQLDPMVARWQDLGLYVRALTSAEVVGREDEPSWVDGALAVLGRERSASDA